MAEYIEREALGIGKCNPDVFENKAYADGWNSAIEIIENAPAADVAPVRHGKWNKSKGNEELTAHGFVQPDEYICSCCNWSCCCEIKLDFKYCPKCGAKMDGDKNG